MIKFSIIVPVYNVEQYLEECINSVLNQTYKDLELILVNDGSKDNSLEVCRRFEKEDQRVKVIDKENGGASDARNHGLDAVSGDYIIFLDGDDYWNIKNALELLNEKISKYQSEAVIFGCTDFNMNTGEVIISRTGYNLDLINDGGIKDALHYLLSSKLIPGGPTIFCTKSDIVNGADKIRFKTGIQDEDYDFVLSVFLKCKKLSAINEPFYTYRKGRADSVTGSSNIKMIYGIEYTVNKWLPLCEKIKDEVIKKDVLNYIAFIYSTGFVVTGRMNKENRKKSIEIMKKYVSVLDYAYWKKPKITKYAVRLLGFKLFSILSSYYFKYTHL